MSVSTEAVCLSRDEIGSILSRYEAYLTAIANRELPHAIRDRVDPADVVQTTLMHVAKFMAENEVEVATLGGLLRASLLNTIASEARTHNARKRTVRRTHRLDSALFTACGHSVDAADSCMVQEEIGQLMEAMADLSPIHCEVLRLRYFDGLSREEIGQRIGRTDQATAGLIKRAKAALRGVMLSASA